MIEQVKKKWGKAHPSSRIPVVKSKRVMGISHTSHQWARDVGRQEWAGV